MDYREFTRVLFKVAGLLLIGYVIIEIPAFISFYHAYQVQSLKLFFFSSIVPMLFPLVIGLALFLFPKKISNQLVQNEDSGTFEMAESAALERILITVIGLYFLFRAVSDLTYNLSTLILAENVSITTLGGGLSPAILVSTIAELIFALVLLFGRDRLVTFLNRSK